VAIIERPQREPEVGPGLALLAGRAQQVGRVIGDDDRHVAQAVDAAAQARERALAMAVA
jgi:hypothetical protein